MSNAMFCYQCQETVGNKGCTQMGVCGKKPQVRLVTRKPVTAGGAELEENPRARSAKLRVAEKCGFDL